MTDVPAWPGEPGAPLNPEQDGVHVLKIRNGPYQARKWSCKHQAWLRGELGRTSAKDIAEAQWEYVGCCLTPAEVARLEREAELRGAASLVAWFRARHNPNFTADANYIWEELAHEVARLRALFGA